MMPNRPMSHEQRQYQAKVARGAAPVRKAHDYAYAQHRAALHGPDPRSSGRWQRLRLMVLAREPLCHDPYAAHHGEPVPATEVDHVLGVWQAPEQVFDEANLMPLCRACHARKSMDERRCKKS